MIMVKNKLKEQKGAISIIFIILSLILIMIITAFMTINKSTYLQNEVQSVMDSSATSALSMSIDKSALKKEMFTVGSSYISGDGTKKSINQSQLEDIVKTNYMNELAQNLGQNSIDGIMSYDITNFSVELSYTDWGVSDGQGKTIKRPQLIMNSVVQVKVKSYADFDLLSTYTTSLYNARTSKNDVSVTVAGRTNDGEIILAVRTLARLVYR